MKMRVGKAFVSRFSQTLNQGQLRGDLCFHRPHPWRLFLWLVFISNKSFLTGRPVCAQLGFQWWCFRNRNICNLKIAAQNCFSSSVSSSFGPVDIDILWLLPSQSAFRKPTFSLLFSAPKSPSLVFWFSESPLQFSPPQPSGLIGPIPLTRLP